jgi:predicted  nucleic acid-binding Zn-ribbon protein
MAIFLNPVVFFVLLAILLLAGLLTAFFSFREDAKYKGLRAEAEAARSAKENLEKKLSELQRDLDKAKEDLGLKEAMYEGLKGQYAELEKETEKFRQQPSSEAAVNNPPAPVKPDKPVMELLQDLQKIQGISKDQ